MTTEKLECEQDMEQVYLPGTKDTAKSNHQGTLFYFFHMKCDRQLYYTMILI